MVIGLLARLSPLNTRLRSGDTGSLSCRAEEPLRFTKDLGGTSLVLCFARRYLRTSAVSMKGPLVVMYGFFAFNWSVGRCLLGVVLRALL